jgi:two-component system, NtrC family, sensor kinase
MSQTGVETDRPLREELSAQSITVRIRWFGIVIGYGLVNVLGTDGSIGPLNAILGLGMAYALCDTYYYRRGKTFLSEYPLFISLMEAVFIGLLCLFDAGVLSPFRFYYFLSLMVSAIRYVPTVTYTTLALHLASFGLVSGMDGYTGREGFSSLVLTPLLMAWVAWASTSLANLLKRAGQRLTELNTDLEQNRLLLEDRIAQRTRQLQETQAMIVQQEKQAAFGLLAAGIAHEVGNPLAAISSLVQLLHRRHTDDLTRERLSMVDEQLRRIQRTLRELVDFSRPATKLETLADVHGIIDAALNIAKYYKRRKGKRIITSYARGIPTIRVVRDQLTQVVLNLILNAMEATPEGGSIELHTSLVGGWLRIAVRDTGPGISPSHRDRMFQPYFTTKETGTGLGLFVCRNIVEQQLGGQIELTASSTNGTTFTIYLTHADLRQLPDAHPTESVSSDPEPVEEVIAP